MKYFMILLLFPLGLFVSSPVPAATGIGEGYASITFRELSQALLMLGGADIKDPVVVDEYAKLAYCGLYQQHYKNDFEWNNIRSRIAARVTEKKEYFRVLFQTSDVFMLGRYDSDSQSFPLTPDTAMRNVGSMRLVSPREGGYRFYCGIEEPSEIFMPTIVLSLLQPVTAGAIKMTQAEAEKLVARMAAEGNTDRRIYGRIRFQVTGARRVLDSRGRGQSTELQGDITSIDFFMDRELSKPMPGAVAEK